MDRLAAHVIATAALTVTLATVPVLFADASHAASTSAPAVAAATPSQTSDADPDGSLPALPPLDPAPQTPAPLSAPAGPALDDHSPYARLRTAGGRPCPDVRQVGHTTHALYRGMIAFSVREYYSPSCHSYYGYSFAWHRFRRLHVRFDVGMAVFDDKRDAIDGARTYVGGEGGPGYWSAAVPADGDGCTQGEGHYFYYPADAPGGFEEGDTFSTRVCS